MKKPKAVLFDFGGTLFSDGENHIHDAVKALRLAADNPEASDDVELLRFTLEINERKRIFDNELSGSSPEIPLTAMIENATKRAGLKYSKSLDECGIIFDTYNCSERKPMPNIKELLKTLEEKRIRTAVISNTVMSGVQMSASIENLLPENSFEFVFTSADFIFKKPCPDMFEAAVKQLGLLPEECWYCGDSFANDVVGSSNIGMFPVYINKNAENPVEFTTINSTDCCVVNDWSALIKIILDS